MRRQLLWGYCLITKLNFPEVEDIIGIATETGNNELRSEDIAYLDARTWTPELDEEARSKKQELKTLGLLGDTKMSTWHESEYPDIPVSKGIPRVTRKRGRIGRNAPCPCGSGKKYKRCHG